MSRRFSQPIPFLDLSSMHADLRPQLDEAWRQVSSQAKFIGGEYVERFEMAWASYCARAYCVGLSDGTAALELALRALGIGPGDEVIVPANTFIATWEAILAVGATPVGVDVDPNTLLITATIVEDAITINTAAIIVVHLFGQMADMDAINRIAKRAGLNVIEDAAQAHGATWNGQRAGSLSDVGCFSFYPGKNLGAFGDAGAIVTNRPEIARRVRSFANHGRHQASADRHIHIGGNRRLDGLQAAILSVKLDLLDLWNSSRRRAYAQYAMALKDVQAEMVGMAPEAVSAHHLMVVQIPDRDMVQRALAVEGIATGVHYRTPCHRQPALTHLARSPLPVVERAAQRILSLPMYPHLTESQIGRVARALAAALPQAAKPSRRRRTEPRIGPQAVVVRGAEA